MDAVFLDGFGRPYILCATEDNSPLWQAYHLSMGTFHWQPDRMDRDGITSTADARCFIDPASAKPFLGLLDNGWIILFSLF